VTHKAPVVVGDICQRAHARVTIVSLAGSDRMCASRVVAAGIDFVVYVVTGDD
jgi:hypothetical protein